MPANTSAWINWLVRVIAPFGPLASSSPIAIIVRDALKRAGVKNVNLRGAYLGNTRHTPLDFVHYPWSHSLAMSMLWAGLFALAYYMATRYRALRADCVPALVAVRLCERSFQRPTFERRRNRMAGRHRVRSAHPLGMVV